MKINKIDHICIAVKNLEEARKKWEPILGKSEPDDPYVDEESKIRVARYILGDVGFELMEDLTGDGDVSKHIAARGETVVGAARRCVARGSHFEHLLLRLVQKMIAIHHDPIGIRQEPE